MTKTITVIFAVSVLAAVLMGGLVLSPIAFAGNGQVTICHKPGTPAEQTKEIDSPAVAAHLAHGDTLGPCGPPPPFCDPSPCDDGNECTIDVCNEEDDTCDSIPVPQGTPCDIGICDESGACVEPPGCVTNDECSPEDYCAKLVGADPLSEGVCEVRPEVCIPLLDIVCGVDGLEYLNACFAAIEGVNIAHVGFCNNDI